MIVECVVKGNLWEFLWVWCFLGFDFSFDGFWSSEGLFFFLVLVFCVY